jgi:DNA-binding CsgD family transcriptional regulator/PAS domain-containing protein
MARADAIQATMQQIYDKTLEPDGWSSVLPSIAAVSRSKQSALLVRSAVSGAVEVCGSSGTAPENWARFAAVMSAGRAPSFLRVLPATDAVRSSAVLEDREFERSAFYNEAVRPTGGFYAVVASLLRTHKQEVFFIVGRDLGREDYGHEDAAAVKKLLPHLATAFRISHQLRAADLRAAGAVAALDRLDNGVVLLDASTKIAFANRAAEILLDGNNGLRVNADGLSAVDANADNKLRLLIAACVWDGSAKEGPGRSVDVPRGADRAPLRILVAPCGGPTAQEASHWLRHARPAAMLLITDPERDRLARKEELRRRFGLTSAEAEVAFEIVRGDGREAAAARLGISVTTASTHLTHIFEKTGTRRQAQLVRLLLDGQRADLVSGSS